MFAGLSAFPLTPIKEDSVDEGAFVRLVERLVAAGADSIGALGSTGSYAYLSRAERARVAQLAVANAGAVPVMIGIGSVRTRDVLALAEDAQQAGAASVMLAPVSYQKLTENEVFGLYEAVTRTLSVPLCVYDNPGTTNFVFSDELHARIAQLPNVGAIKIPGVSTDPELAHARIARVRALVPAHVSIGISGDVVGANGMNAGCSVWFSVIGGLFPATTLAIARAAQEGNSVEALALSARLEPLWALFRQHGSLRVIASAAELLGLVSAPCLPAPLHALDHDARQQLGVFLARANLG